jgi:hypothetical protein
MSDKIYRVNVEKIAGRPVSGFIGEAGDLVYDPDTGVIAILDGTTPGGTEITPLSTSGASGWSGTSGYSGVTGTSGWSGVSGFSGSGVSGWSGSFVAAGSVAPATAKGAAEDKSGEVIVTATHIYFCTADYTDGNDDIWTKVAIVATPWA